MTELIIILVALFISMFAFAIDYHFRCKPKIRTVPESLNLPSILETSPKYHIENRRVKIELWKKQKTLKRKATMKKKKAGGKKPKC